MYIIDEEESTWSIKQERMDFGERLAETQVMARIFDSPQMYPVNRTGFYCMGVAPLRAPTSALNNATINQFHGEVIYHNRFTGHLSAADHPKLYVRFTLLMQFYAFMTLVYLGLSIGWILLCFKHRDQIVTVQHFVSVILLFLVVEMACQWLFYRFYNANPIDMRHFVSTDQRRGSTSIARFLLVLTNILESMRDSMSFFLLLIVSMGYGVVHPTIGPVIVRVYALTGLHFAFSIMYSIGIIFVLLDTTNAWVGAFILPMAFTLTVFYMWILSSLRNTIQDLQERHQTFKMNMFKRLQAILLGSVAFLTLYFFGIIAMVALTGTSDFVDHSWKYRWFLLDGVLVLLYLGAFGLIAWSWRPTGNNMRLAMSDELATDEEVAAGQFDVHTIGADHDDLDDDAQEVNSVHLYQLSRTPKDTSAARIHETETHYAAVESDDDDGDDHHKHESNVLFESDKRDHT
ncbi:hypothetical protein MNAN1_000394 [Malassezia nana]|uniref:GOST seven transmembrane domain-containing protein n=1 Tax=Malassezia nana TaxID=180528 RepID=A0AAF0J126_9BASI|nr:hypothetical protein MNAN1_000394 [Malassezia nana]